MLLVFSWRSTVAPAYIFPALVFSVCGDVLLALPLEHGFVFGLSAFLLAQLTYSVGFYRARRPKSEGKIWLQLTAVIAYSIALGFVLLPRTGELMLPVAIYLLAITFMACTAAMHRYYRITLFAGALVFVLSDSMIAIDKFLVPFDGSRYAIMTTYYLAQAMITWSILDDARR